ELEGMGAAVEVYTGSLADAAELDGFLARVRGSLGDIGGVVHCAGRLPAPRPFIHQDLADLQAAYEPKADGLETLAARWERARPAFFLLFSSLAGTLPELAAGVAGYAGANAFLDLFAGCQARAGRPWFRSLAWPSWRGAGSAVPEPPAYERLGLGSIDVEAGLRLFEAALGPGGPAALVALPGLAPGADPSALLAP